MFRSPLSIINKLETRVENTIWKVKFVHHQYRYEIAMPMKRVLSAVTKATFWLHSEINFLRSANKFYRLAIKLCGRKFGKGRKQNCWNINIPRVNYPHLWKLSSVTLFTHLSARKFLFVLQKHRHVEHGRLPASVNGVYVGRLDRAFILTFQSRVYKEYFNKRLKNSPVFVWKITRLEDLYSGAAAPSEKSAYYLRAL